MKKVLALLFLIGALSAAAQPPEAISTVPVSSTEVITTRPAYLLGATIHPSSTDASIVVYDCAVFDATDASDATSAPILVRWESDTARASSAAEMTGPIRCATGAYAVLENCTADVFVEGERVKYTGSSAFSGMDTRWKIPVRATTNDILFISYDYAVRLTTAFPESWQLVD